MGTRHFCDICENDLSNDNGNIYNFVLSPNESYSRNDPPKINHRMEICHDCAMHINGIVVKYSVLHEEE